MTVTRSVFACGYWRLRFRFRFVHLGFQVPHKTHILSPHVRESRALGLRRTNRDSLPCANRAVLDTLPNALLISPGGKQLRHHLMTNCLQLRDTSRDYILVN